MKTMKKPIHLILPALLLALVCVFAWQPRALAYFDQGPVGVSVGRQSITLEQGQSGSVSVTFSPSSSSQLPGCGMAECPQTCGEKECLDENGQCTCNGETYQTYYAFAAVSSSNTSVATASYGDSGVVTINAVSPGTATITVTASLRQYSSSSTSISVTVEAKSTGSGSSGSSSSGSTGSGSSTSGSSSSGSSTSGSSSSGSSSSGSSTSGSSSSGSSTSGSSGSGSSSSGSSSSGSSHSGSSTSGSSSSGSSGSGSSGSGSSTSGSSGSGSSSSGSSSSGSSTSGSSGSGSTTSGSTTSGSSTSGSSTSGSATSGSATSGSATSGGATSGSTTSGGAGSIVIPTVPGTPAPSHEPNSSGITVTQITGGNAEEATGEEATGEEPVEEETPEVPEEPYSVVESMRGTIYFVPITEGKMGGDIFAQIIGQEMYADFQKKDAADNILYAWEFCGADLTGTDNLVLTLDAGTAAFSGCPYGDPSDTLYISFGENGPLPAEASLYLHVSEYFADGDVLYLYSYGDDGALELLADGVSPENGYLAAALSSRSNLILTAQKLAAAEAVDEEQPETGPSGQEAPAAEEGGISPVLAVVLVVVGVLIVAAIVVIVCRRKAKPKVHSND